MEGVGGGGGAEREMSYDGMLAASFTGGSNEYPQSMF